MKKLPKITIAAILLGGIATAANAQLADAIVPDPGFEPDWVTLGSATFDAAQEKTILVGGWRAQDLDMVALQPLAAGVECTNMAVQLADGTTQHLPVSYEGEMREDWIYKMQLQGSDENVIRVDLSCSSTEGNVSIVQVYGIPDGLTGQGAQTPY